MNKWKTIQFIKLGNTRFPITVPLDSLKYLLSKEYLKTKKKEEFGYQLPIEILVNWRSQTPRDSIKKIILECKEAYQLIYQDLAAKWFNKTYYEINTKQMDSIFNHASFLIVLDVNRKPIVTR